MRKIFFIIMLLSFIQAETLEQTMAAALRNSDRYQTAFALYRQAQEKQYAIQRAYLPLLKYDYTYKYVSEVSSLKTSIMDVDFGSKDTYDNGFTVNWLVFDGFGREAKLTAAEINTGLAETEVKNVQRAVVYSALRQYTSIVQLRMQQEAVQADCSRIITERNRVQHLVAQGQAIPLDVLSLDLQINGYNQQLLALKKQEATLQDNLQDDVGPVTVVTFSPVVREEIPKLLLANTTDWQKIVLQERLSTVNEIAAAADFYPDVSVYGSTRRGKPGVDQIKDKWMSYQTAGVGVQWLLWDWGGRLAESAAQKAATEAIVSQKREIKKRINTGYINACREYVLQQQQLKLCYAARDLAQKRVALFAARYVQGLVSTTDFIQAQQDYSAACLKAIDCRYAVYLKALELDYVSGKEIQEWRIS